MPVHLEVNHPGVRFVVEPPGGGRFRLCTPPCDMRLRPGRYSLLLRLEDRDPIPATPASIDLTRPASLEGTYQSNRWRRVLAGIFGVLGAIGAATLAGSIVWLHRHHDDRCESILVESDCHLLDVPFFGALAAGGSVMVIASAIAVPMLGPYADRARVETRGGP